MQRSRTKDSSPPTSGVKRHGSKKVTASQSARKKDWSSVEPERPGAVRTMWRCAPPAAAREWECMRDFAGGVDLSWRDDAISILEAFTERTPGSVLEPKDSCLTWHYADADPDFGLSQAKNLQLHIDQMLANQVRECSLSLLRTFPL